MTRTLARICNRRNVLASTFLVAVFSLVATAVSCSMRSNLQVADTAELREEDMPKCDQDDPLEAAECRGANYHARLLSQKGPYLSAAACKECHPGHYKEWSVSPHAYAQLSPVFNAMHGKILKLTNGTNGDFCIRCHTPVGMELGEKIFDSNLNRHPVSREGITCIVCHRVKQPYGKISGRYRIQREGETGDIFEPVYGPVGNENLKRAVTTGRIKVDRDSQARALAAHSEIKRASHLSASSFCGICHDVTLMNGFRLEEAFSEYKTSPAAAEGTSCQDCHMGYEPGVPNTYRLEPAAVVTGIAELPKRKRTNHMFIGPDYSVVHPGIFPHNPDALEFRAPGDWLSFDWKAGWGTPEFEDNVDEEHVFPPGWDELDARESAREFIEENLERLVWAQKERNKLLKLGYQLGQIVPLKASSSGIKFKVEVSNGTNGHGVPTGFDAERLVYLQVTVTDAAGNAIMKSGDLDPNGDLRDLHSLYVHNNDLPLDKQLFNLQSKFITRNIRGGEREQVLAVNTSLSALRFLRPATTPTILTGRPLGARKHKQNIAPDDSRWAEYSVAASALTGKGPYTAEVKIISGMVPVNLIHEIHDVGFDYNMSARQVAHAVVYGLDGRIEGPEDAPNDYGGHTVLHTRVHTFDLHAN